MGAEAGDEPVSGFLTQMNKNVGAKEREEKPCGGIAVEVALGPYVAPFELGRKLAILGGQIWIEGEVHGGAYQTCREVGNEETLGFVAHIGSGGSGGDGLVEIACLEKEEAHEEVAPLHDLRPPGVVGVAADLHGM